MVVHGQSIDVTVSDSRTMSHFFNILKKKDGDGNVIIAIDINIIDIFETFAKEKDSRKCISSIPPLEGEGRGKKGKDEQAAVMVSSFGGTVLRWCHSIFWNRKEGQSKDIIEDNRGPFCLPTHSPHRHTHIL